MNTRKKYEEQAQRLFDNKKYKEVIELLTDKVPEKAKRAELYTQRAWAHNRLMESERALYYVNKALAHNPADARAIRAMGYAFSGKKEYDKAIKNYTEVIALDPVSEVAFYDRGLAWLYKNEFDLAISDLNKAINLNPRYANALNNRSLAWLSKKDYEKAIDDLNKTIELDPGQARLFNNRGNVRALMQEYDMALSDYNTAIQLNPLFAGVYRNRGFVFEAVLKEYQKAIDDYTRAIEIGKADNIEYGDVSHRRDILSEKIREQELLQEIKTKPGCETIMDVTNELEDIVEEILKIAKVTEPQTAAFYTKLSALDNMLPLKGKSETRSRYKLRNYNAMYLADKRDGKFIFDCFANNKRNKIEKAFELGRASRGNNVYLSVFFVNDKSVVHEDDLAIWSTFKAREGDNNEQDCSLVIDKAFFDEHKDVQVLEQTTDGRFMEEGDDSPQFLYQVLYYKSKQFLNDEGSRLKKLVAVLETLLVKLIDLKDACENEPDEETIDGLIFHYLSRICYLFKPAEQNLQKEMRMVKYVPFSSELIKMDENSPARLYIESNKPLLPHLNKIYISPAVKKPEHWLVNLKFRVQLNESENQALKKIDIKILTSEIPALSGVV